MAQMVKNLPMMQETWVPGLGRSPGEGSGNSLQYSFFFFFFHSSILAWRSPWTEELRKEGS